jgi:hypothetical protein
MNTSGIIIERLSEIEKKMVLPGLAWVEVSLSALWRRDYPSSCPRRRASSR